MSFPSPEELTQRYRTKQHNRYTAYCCQLTNALNAEWNPDTNEGIKVILDNSSYGKIPDNLWKKFLENYEEFWQIEVEYRDDYIHLTVKKKE